MNSFGLKFNGTAVSLDFSGQFHRLNSAKIKMLLTEQLVTFSSVLLCLGNYICSSHDIQFKPGLFKI